ncbi:RsmB/NOP family class I SAM-dependent RNA methyltransferase [Tepidimonas charontis]|uniref:Ribosomal RNA small subunit methyltransferase B n=1 Tax=Tepidimonas charontis TaxID=2267262 RepID=A0A554XGG7_9BURK|nr:RsmB/NOP family class I SAM-dependent RNA methyltransferase [Tepidimonas charontis]TSE34925.1 Ribosomal RNA small subunit methyltransferase B [Tepidimonas charontis]
MNRSTRASRAGPAGRPHGRDTAPAGAKGLELAARLLQQSLHFRQPPDALLAQALRGPQRLGVRGRAAVGDALFAALRDLPRWHHLRARVRGDAPTPLDVQRLREDIDACGDIVALAWPDDAVPVWGSDDAPQAQRALALRAAAAALAAAPLPDGVRFGLPDWLYQRLRAVVGEALPALADALRAPAPLDLRVNALRAKREAVLSEWCAAGLPAVATPYAPWGIRLPARTPLQTQPAWVWGHVEVQDEGSQLIAALVGARRGETVVDFCAGAGGKTLALGAEMRNTGRLYAFDTVAARLQRLQERVQRAGLTHVHPMALSDESDPRLQRLAGKIDRVLVDAPCSGLGTLRRHPELKWRHDPSTIAQAAALQQRILQAAARLVRPGGRLVYATCSLLPEENEAVAQAFTESTRGRFEPLDACTLLTQARVTDAHSLTEQGALRLWPHVHGTDGFYAVAWQRR